MVLVRGLSPQSATVAKIHSKRYIGQKPKAAESVVSGEKAAQHAFEALFSGLAPKGTPPA